MREISNSELETPLTPVRDALNTVLSLLSPVSVETLPLGDARGLTSARIVTSPIDVAPFASSSMDGWAVIASGAGPHEVHGRIATGAPLPPEADSVVPWETGTETESGIVTAQPVTPGENVRSAGQDFTAGTELAQAGEALGPIHLATMAAAGIASVAVHRQVQVAVVVTGDEVVPPGAHRADGQIFDANSTLLPGLIGAAGATVVSSQRAGDSLDETLVALRTAANSADIVITTGGASVGQRDWVRAALESDGAIAVWRVAARPGKPFAAGRLAGKPVLALPGNPGSVLACFHTFVVPALKTLAAQTSVEHPTKAGRLSNDVTNDGPREFLVPARFEHDDVTILEGRSSQSVAHARHADGFVRVPPDTKLAPGTFVEVELTS